jgi:hypothetical protein
MWGGIGLPWDRVPVWVHDRVLTVNDAVNIDLQKVRKRYSRLFATWFWESFRILRVLDKSPNYILMTEIIDQAFPDALHVFAMRDAEAILDSIVRGDLKTRNIELRKIGLGRSPAGMGTSSFPATNSGGTGR